MGSAFGLSNATQRNQIRVTQAGHGFGRNDWLYRKADSTYGLAKADADSTADVCGVVSETDGTDNFTLVTSGYAVDLVDFGTWTPGTRYFLSAATAGEITATDPNIANSAYASKPVLIAVTATSGFVCIERSVSGSNLVYDSGILGAAVTTLSATGLDSDTDGGYDVELILVNSSGSTISPAKTFNTDTTTTHYQNVYMYWGPSAGGGGNVNSNNAIAVLNGVVLKATGRIIVTNNSGTRYPFLIWNCERSDNTIVTESIRLIAGLAANITQFVITSDVANGISAGSRLRIWRAGSGQRGPQGPAGGAPSLIVINPMATLPASVGQGTWARAQHTLYFNNGYYQNLGSNGDNVTYKINCCGGTYTIDGVFTTATDRGIVKIQIDGSTVATFDCYGSLTYNAAFQQTGIAITDGLHDLKVLVDGKNASASSYYCTLIYLSLQRTGA